jgi:hypothetical protein
LIKRLNHGKPIAGFRSKLLHPTFKSSIESAPAAMPATIDVIFAAGFAARD